MISALWGVTIWVLWSWSYHGHSVVSHFSFGVGHRGLSLIICLQMDEEFVLPLDTAEIPQCTRLSLGKKLNLFLIILKPFKKVVFLELVDRKPVVQMKRSNDWKAASGIDYLLTPCQSECSDLVSLTALPWKENCEKKIPKNSRCPDDEVML